MPWLRHQPPFHPDPVIYLSGAPPLLCKLLGSSPARTALDFRFQARLTSDVTSFLPTLGTLGTAVNVYLESKLLIS